MINPVILDRKIFLFLKRLKKDAPVAEGHDGLDAAHLDNAAVVPLVRRQIRESVGDVVLGHDVDCVGEGEESLKRTLLDHR